MKTFCIAMAFLALVLCPYLDVRAEPGMDKSSCLKCIEKRIALCQEKAKFRHSDRKNLREYGERKYDEAVFYQENKEKLAKAMAAKQIPEKPHAICYFLIKKYRDI